MNLLENIRETLPVDNFHSHLCAGDSVSSQPNLSKGSLANDVEYEVVANMALLVGRDGYKVITLGDLKT